eukprot:5637563-Prymnesium_polylepis.1
MGVNALLRQLHAERVNAGARTAWAEDEDDDELLVREAPAFQDALLERGDGSFRPRPPRALELSGHGEMRRWTAEMSRVGGSDQ